MQNKIILVGSSGHAKVIVEILESLNYEIIGYVDSFAEIGSKVDGYKILGNEFVLYDTKKIGTNNVCIAIGNNHQRRAMFQKIEAINSKILYPNIISKRSQISKNVSIGKGNVIMDNSIIHTSSVLGDFNIINTSSIIEHDCSINNFISVSPGSIICGNVTIKNESFIGAGSVVIQKTEIGEKTIIGAGSVVISNCDDHSLYLGNPALKKVENYTKINYL